MIGEQSSPIFINGFGEGCFFVFSILKMGLEKVVWRAYSFYKNKKFLSQNIPP